MKLLDKIFQLEEINGHGLHEVYLWRWTLIATRWFKIYLHHFVGDDWSRDLHDHPKRFISIGIWGTYTEETPGVESSGGIPGINRFEIFKAPWVRSFPARHIHRLLAKNCWTVVIVLKRERDWGFWHKGLWVQWSDYVFDPKWRKIAHGKTGNGNSNE